MTDNDNDEYTMDEPTPDEQAEQIVELFGKSFRKVVSENGRVEMFPVDEE